VVAVIVLGWFSSVVQAPQPGGRALGLAAIRAFRRRHGPVDDDTPLRPEPPPPRRPADGRHNKNGFGFRVVWGIRNWWSDSTYLTDVGLGFAVVTVINSVMMVVGWDTPKTGSFAYTHLLGRFAIVAAIMAVFHLDGARVMVAGWSNATSGRRCGRAIASVRGQLPDGLVGRWAFAFTSFTVVACLAVLASSRWREPSAGVELYWALLVGAAALAVVIDRRARRRVRVGSTQSDRT
jgi:hypothetical protein